MPGTSGPQGMTGGIWERPEGRRGPWALKQALGAEPDPQVPDGPSEGLRRELSGMRFGGGQVPGKPGVPHLCLRSAQKAVQNVR